MKKIFQKVLMKVEEMGDVFLDLANFVTLAPPSGYALDLKALSRCQKLAEHLSFDMKILSLHVKKTN